MTTISPTPRTTVKRLPDRGSYEQELIESILDEAPICHVGFVVDGAPFVIPTIHARIGDTLYLHGSPASRMLRHMQTGAVVCVTATLVDALVLARSAFHHSMNYRSAVVIGPARLVDDPVEKMHGFRAIVEHVAPGRWAHVRQPNADEMRKTTLVAVAISEASAKVRSGPVGDDPEDMDLGIWAGLLPLRTVAGAPEPDGLLAPGIAVPEHVLAWRSVDERLASKE